MQKLPKYEVLYFTDGPVPSPEQLAEARKFGPHVRFRNARFAPPGSGLEPCTAVAGHVPSDYKRAYPLAVSYEDWADGKLPVVEQPGPSRHGMADPNPVVGMKPFRILGPAGDPVVSDLPPPPPPADAGMAPIPGLTDAPEAFELPPPPAASEQPPPPPAAQAHGRLSARQREALAKTGSVFGERETA